MKIADVAESPEMLLAGPITETTDRPDEARYRLTLLAAALGYMRRDRDRWKRRALRGKGGSE